MAKIQLYLIGFRFLIVRGELGDGGGGGVGGGVVIHIRDLFTESEVRPAFL